MKRILLKFLLLTTALGCGLLVPAAHAAPYSWTSGASGNWRTVPLPNNWTPSAPFNGPGLGDTADFAGPGFFHYVQLTTATPFSVDAIAFGAPGGDFHFIDATSAPFAPSPNSVTVGTAMTKDGPDSVYFAFVNISTPLLTVNGGNFHIDATNIFLATVANINGGRVCAGAPPAAGATVGGTTWNVNLGGRLNISGTLSVATINYNNGSLAGAGCSPGQGIVNGDVNFGSGSCLEVDLNTPNGPGTDLLTVNGNVNFNGKVVVIAGPNLASPATFTFLNYSGILSGTPGPVSGPGNLTYSLDTNTPGQLKLIVPPQISAIPFTGDPLSENFDGMGPRGTNTPPGWFVGYADSTNLTNVAVSDGSVAPNQTAGWNFGSSNGTDRALGIMATTSNTTGTPPPPAGSRYVEARIRNSTTQNLSSITVSYAGEQWRTGSTTNTVNMLVLQYSADGSNYVDMGAAFNFTQHTFTPLNSALDGNDPANRADRIPPDGDNPWARVIPPDGTVFLRWFNPGGAGADAALAIDNFSFSAQFAPPLVNCPCPTNNLIVNGSFEDGNAIPFGSCDNLPPSTMPGWTVGANVINRCFSGASGVTPSAGNLFLDLSGPDDAPPHGRVTQTVPTTPGLCYRLTFDLGVYPNTPLLAGPITVRVSDGITWQYFTHNPPPGPGTVWSSFAFPFTAGASTVLTIEGVSGHGFIGLDNVALVCSCACTNVCLACPPRELTVYGCPPRVPNFSTYSFACANGAPVAPLTVTQNPPANTSLPPGTTVVVVNVLDALGHSLSCDVVLNAVFTPGCPLCPCRTNNLIVNGSFEDGNAIPFGSCDNLPPSTMPGWTVGALLINRCAGSSGVTASDGTLFLDLTGPNDTMGGAVMQTVPTTIGQCYKLTFDLGVKQDNPILAGPITVKVKTGANTQSFTHTAPPGSGTVWNNYGYLFTAGLANTPITIEGVSGAGYIGLDNVALVCSCDCPPAVLAVALAGTNIVLSWPADATNFELEAAASLSPPVIWLPYDDAVIQEADGHRSVSLPLSEPKRFFRLRGPGNP